MQSSTPSSGYNCTLCNVEFDLRLQLRSHMIQMHNSSGQQQPQNPKNQALTEEDRGETSDRKPLNHDNVEDVVNPPSGILGEIKDDPENMDTMDEFLTEEEKLQLQELVTSSIEEDGVEESLRQPSNEMEKFHSEQIVKKEVSKIKNSEQVSNNKHDESITMEETTNLDPVNNFNSKNTSIKKEKRDDVKDEFLESVERRPNIEMDVKKEKHDVRVLWGKEADGAWYASSKTIAARFQLKDVQLKLSKDAFKEQIEWVNYICPYLKTFNPAAKPAHIYILAKAKWFEAQRAQSVQAQAVRRGRKVMVNYFV